MKAENAWQGASGQRWTELQERTDAQLEPLGRAAMDLVAPQPGERALDVGCGAGGSTLELAARVGLAGSAVGIDISPQLLARAKERALESQVSNVEFVLGDAAIDHFDRPFELVFSRFGVMFFEDSVAAFRNLRAALVSGGRIGFVSWQSCEQNPMMSAPLAAVRKLRPDHPLPPLLDPALPGPFHFSDPAFVREQLLGAGFENIDVIQHEAVVPLGGARTLAEAVDFTLQLGPTSRFIADAGLADDPRVRDAIADALAPYATDRGVRTLARTLLVTARRA